MKPGQIALMVIFVGALVLSVVLFWLTVPKHGHSGSTASRAFSNPGSSPFSDGPSVPVAVPPADVPPQADVAKASAALAKAFPSDAPASTGTGTTNDVTHAGKREATASVSSIGRAAPPASDSPSPPPSLDKDSIRSAMQEIKPLIRDCYESALKLQPDLAGKVTVEFELAGGPDGGTVVSGQVPDSETHSPFFEACVLQKVRGAHFAAPSGEGHVKVRYPFMFDPGGGFGPAPGP